MTYIGRFEGLFHDEDGSVNEGLHTIPRARPRYGVLDALWIYEIDLDHDIFHVNGIQYFDLKSLPNDEPFFEFVLEDDYDNISGAPECSPEHNFGLRRLLLAVSVIMTTGPSPPPNQSSIHHMQLHASCIGPIAVINLQ
jgi:hypothetical protein